MRTAVYAGSFNPPTVGHFDIIRRSLAFCDKLIVVVGINPAKRNMFTPEERVELLKNDLTFLYLDDPETVEVIAYDGMMIECARQRGASILIRGVRSNFDFEVENNLAQINKSLNNRIDTVILPTDQKLSHISSSAVKELARFGAPIYNMVSTHVAQEVYKKFGNTTEVKA